MNETPRSLRLHIGIFGKRNSGKSSLINTITGQDTALVSDVPGTTTDPVYKSMEIHGIGPCVLIDTAGFDDEGEIGLKRVEKTLLAMDKTDIALLVISAESDDFTLEYEYLNKFKEKKIPVITILNKIDLVTDLEKFKELNAISVSTKAKTGIDKVLNSIIRNLPEDYESKTITGSLAKGGDLILLVMPQDIQAPKGRLILPQVQTIRELLDKKCLIMSCTTDKLDDTFLALSRAPDLIITDSQVFKTVYEKKPKESKLTSFSVLFAALKGDIDYFTKSAYSIGELTETSRVLIAEACTHAPLTEDIGREKIPAILRKRFGQAINIDMVSGSDFPEDLEQYDLIIQCGSCMFNRKYVLSRVEKAKKQNIPMTNYGITIAYLSGILDKININ